jgi:Domain of unknown function (DUF4160)
MPSVFRKASYRVYFFSHEPNESPHIHIDRDEKSAKFWLRPVRPAANVGFDGRDLRKVQLLIEEYEEQCLEAWHGHFGTGSR